MKKRRSLPRRTRSVDAECRQSPGGASAADVGSPRGEAHDKGEP